MKRKTKLIGTYNHFLNNIIEDRIMARRLSRRPRTRFFDELEDRMSCPFYQEEQVANNRAVWLQQSQGLSLRSR